MVRDFPVCLVCLEDCIGKWFPTDDGEAVCGDCAATDEGDRILNP